MARKPPAPAPPPKKEPSAQLPHLEMRSLYLRKGLISTAEVK